jgi:hypothetical protein
LLNTCKKRDTHIIFITTDTWFAPGNLTYVVRLTSDWVPYNLCVDLTI